MFFLFSFFFVYMFLHGNVVFYGEKGDGIFVNRRGETLFDRTGMENGRIVVNILDGHDLIWVYFEKLS